jgi:general stress protein 26
MDDQNTEAGRRKVLDLIDGIDYAVFTTRGDGGAPLHARPMAYRKVEGDGDLWFFTKKGSRKIAEIAADARTLVSFADPKKQHFVSITGRSEMVDDRATVKAMWNEIYRTWFPGGPDDDEVVLIRVHAEAAEYWDSPNSVMVYAYGYLKAVVTGKPARAGEIGKVDLA